MNKIRVLYIEDDPDWRDGLRQFLAGHESIELYACASNVAEGMAYLANGDTDVVLMDILLDDAGHAGLDATLDIALAYPGVKIVMLSSLDSDDEVFNEAFLNGAYEYVYKFDFEQLPAVIANAMLHPASKYGERLRKLVYEQKRGLLSDGDRVLLGKIASGRTQTEIAEDLQISLAAVKKHVGRVMKKFHWKRSSKELAERCAKWGLLDKGI